MHSFFIISPLNLENEVKKELLLKWPLYIDDELPTYEVISGGIEINCSLEHGFLLNQILRSPNRILLRIKSQKCRDLPKLFKIFSKIEWKKYLVKESANLKITAKESRLIHTGRIKKAASEGMAKYFEANKIRRNKLDLYKDTDDANIYIRLNNDELTVSLDTTGELLYKRDEVEFKGHAPLRNNLAYIVNQFLVNNIKMQTNKITLIDPMCGSGTLLHEAYNFYKTNKRRFYFENLSERPVLKDCNNILYKDFCGFDINEKIISKLSSEYIKFEKRDLFNQNKYEGDYICLLNAPYGKKIKLDESPKTYYKRLFNAIQKTYNPKAIGILAPEGVNYGTKANKKLKIFNNGIWTELSIFELHR